MAHPPCRICELRHDPRVKHFPIDQATLEEPSRSRVIFRGTTEQCEERWLVCARWNGRYAARLEVYPGAPLFSRGEA